MSVEVQQGRKGFVLKNTISRIIRLLVKRNKQEYFACPKENLSHSNIVLDLRNPLSGKKYVHIGKDSSINATFTFETETGFVDIGNRVFMGGGTFICRSNIKIDDNVQIAWNCLFYDHNAHSFNYKERRKDIDVFLDNLKNGRNVQKNEGKDWTVVSTKPIHICHDSWIGANVTVLAGVTIGEGAIIGAGSVVREDIPAWTIAYGNPCKVVAENKYREVL